MAQYKYAHYLKQLDHPAYDVLHEPGAICADSGIYRCESCGDEIASNKGNPFPPQNHHQHAPGTGRMSMEVDRIRPAEGLTSLDCGR